MMVKRSIPVDLARLPLASGAVTAELQFSQLTWTEFEELIAALARDEAGATVVTGSTDGDTQLWTVNASDAIKRICAIPGDELTPAQWHRYIPRLPYTATCPR